MRQPQGYSIITGPGPGAGEQDTFTCAHCGCVKFVAPMARAEDMGGICHLCGDKHRPSFICDKPECHARCDPFEKKLERWEARERLVRHMACS